MSSAKWPQPEAETEPLPHRRGLLTGVFLSVVVIGLVAAWSLRDKPVEVVRLGSPAPNFELVLFDGSEFALSDHIANDGRPMVINLWASWCAPCRAEIPGISDWAEKNPGVYVLGVAVEDAEPAARKLADELQPVYDLGMGDEIFRSAYRSIGLPVTYVTDSEGIVTEVINGIVTESSLDEIFAS